MPSIAEIIMRAGERPVGPRVNITVPSEAEKAQTRLLNAQAAKEEAGILKATQAAEKARKIDNLYKVAYDSRTGKVDYDYLEQEMGRRGWVEEAQALSSTRSELQEKAGKANKEVAKARQERAKADAMATEQIIRSSVDTSGNIIPNLLVREYQKKAKDLGLDPTTNDPGQILQNLRSKRDYSKLEDFEYNVALKNIEAKAETEAATITAQGKFNQEAFKAVADSSKGRRKEVGERAIQSSNTMSILQELSAVVNSDGSVQTDKLAPVMTFVRELAHSVGIPVDSTKLHTGVYIMQLHEELSLKAAESLKGPASDKDMKIIDRATVGLTTPKDIINTRTKAQVARLKVDTVMDNLFGKDIAIKGNMPPYATAAALDAEIRNTPIVAFTEEEGLVTFWEYLAGLKSAGQLEGTDEIDRMRNALGKWRAAYHRGEM